MKFLAGKNNRKRLTAFLLAIAMIVTSLQTPDRVSYAAEVTDSSIEGGQEFLEPSEEEMAAALTTTTEVSQKKEADLESGSEGTDEEENAVSVREEQQKDSAVSDEEETQPDESLVTDGDNRTESVTEEETTIEDVRETASGTEAKPDKYHYENFEQTYTALDGTTLSSKADGKPKVLIFYRIDSTTCQATIKSISDDISAFCGADIYAIEVNSDKKDRVSSFKVLYGCDNILFAYDEAAGVNLGKMSEYTEKAGIPDGTEVDLPIIAYIDANDEFQLLTKGQSSAPDVLANLEEYCDYAFKITYVLNGGENDNDNPNTYTSQSDTIVLKNATKNGYAFEGWYQDAAFTQDVTEIAKGHKGDITLYAKWTVDKYNKTNPTQNYKTVEEKTIYSRAAGKPKVLIFYRNDSTPCQATIKSISDDSNIFCNADLYAIECSAAAKADVSTFQKQYGCDKIQFAYNTTKDANIKNMSAYTEAIGIPEGTDIPAPVICYIDANNKFQLLTKGQSSADDVLSNLEEYCDYAFRITYELDGGTNDDSNPTAYSYKSETIALKNPSKDGCTFKGWYKDANYSEQVTEIAKGSTGDITLYARWRVTEYNLENLDQTYTALDDTKLSSKAIGKPKVLIFYINDSFNDRCKDTIKSIRDNIKELSGADIYAIECGKGTKDSVSTFQNSYGCSNILFAYDTGTDNETCMKAYEEKGDNKQTNTYPLICYIDADNRFQMMTVGESLADDVLTNLKDYCGYVVPEGVYSIKYELDGGMNDSGNPAIYTSETTVLLRDPVKEGYFFGGWYKDASFKEKVTEIAVGSTGDITLYAHWKVNAYNFPNPDERTYKALDGTELSSNANGKPKVLIFYSSGSARSKNTIKSVSDNINDFGDLDIYAIECNKATKNTVNAIQGSYGCEKILFAYDTAGTVNMPSMQAYEKAATGTNATTPSYPIICYIDANNRFQLMTVGESSADDILTNLMEYCGYVFQEETYKITYELNGGTNDSSNPSTYTSRTETIVLKDAVREGCTFEGWYQDAQYSEKVTEIAKGSRGDITLYAKWKVQGYNLPNLDQTYTALDGTQLNSKADGKPKVLIFYYQDRNDTTKNTIQSIRDRIGEFFGVDIYVIECNSDTKVNVSKFQEQYGCDKMLFAYDETKDVNTIKMSEYTEAIGIPGGTDVMLPVICYIDENNVFQLLTQGESSAQDILTNLQEYCGYVFQEGVYKITFFEKSFVYNGTAQKPDVEVTTVENGKYVTLKSGTDYTLSYKNNKNAGTATVTVKGKGQYTGTIEENFVIEPAPLVIRAEDMVILVGDKIPEKYGYEVDGLQGTDKLIQAPILTCDIAGTEQEGEYFVTPSGADAGSNYVITYENGVLIVAKEYVYWEVTFDTQGHGKAPAAYRGVRSGDTIDSPTEPKAEGYRFDGWYQDSECTIAWDFASNIVESDITLYAKWLCVSSDGSFALQEIPDQCYTGKALKPAVSVYDGDTLLKAGKDYQLKYYNNINVNDEPKGADFDPALPYIEVIGKGNYTNTVKVNFNILKASIGDGGMTPAQGVVLKVNDQLVTSKNPLKPSVSLKAGKALKKDTDFKLDIYAYNTSGDLYLLANSEIPAGSTGEFKIVITGIGNYEGSIYKWIYIAKDSSHLLKNAKITLGKKVQTMPWTGKPITIPSTTKEGNENAFIVQMEGKNKPVTLKKGTHYNVIPWEGSAGKAELIIEGIYPYVGRQSIPFYVKGWAFSNSTVSVSGITDKNYTGKAWTQNDVVVTYKGASGPRVYGVDYTIKYSKNINKGIATMTIIGNPKEGYTGSVKKTFKIKATDIADKSQVIRDPSMESITVRYDKAGAKPVDEIILTSKEGVRLRYGKDYTLKYKDNKAVTENATITVTGKGNYSGSFDVPFKIAATDLREDNIVVLPVAVAYNENKPDDFVYKPSVKLKDGKVTLAAGKDYDIEYLKNKQSDYRNYLDKLKAGVVPEEDDVPRVRITAKAGSNYSLPENIAIDVELQIYQTKFDKKKLSVQIVGDAVYTSGQVTPQVTVSYDGKTLEEGKHYRLTYGANDKAGKNKGSVIVIGLAPYYGGSVTCKFDIVEKDLKY